MPGELSKRECKAHNDSIEYLEREYSRLSDEEDRVLLLTSEASAVLLELQAQVGELTIIVASSEHDVEIRNAELRRCIERAEEDCGGARARLALAELFLTEARRALEEAEGRLPAAQARRQLLGNQLDEIVRTMVENEGSRRQHRDDMAKGHCFRPARP